MNRQTTPAATILVVDDNYTNLRVLVDYLEESGFDTLVATSGAKAVQQANRFPPDLILLDVMMSGIDGFETCRRLKANEATRDIPVIFMTTLNDVDDKIARFEAGAVDYVTKPFQQKEVLARITTHLTLHRLQQDIRASEEKLRALLEYAPRAGYHHQRGRPYRPGQRQG
jgi:DNA-binding response OmpR family regulator